MKKISWQKNLLLLWLSQLAVMSGFSAMIPFVPLFMKEKYAIADTSELAFYVASFNFFGTLAYAVFCPIWGVLADKFGFTPQGVVDQIKDYFCCDGDDCDCGCGDDDCDCGCDCHKE